MLRRLNLAPRMTLLILAGTGAILAAFAISDYLSARNLLKDELRDKARELARATAREMEVIHRAVEKIVAQIAVSQETRPFTVDEAFRLLERTLGEHRELLGSSIALALPGAEGRTAEAIPYVYREGGAIHRKDLASGGYPYRTLDWYQLPLELGRPVWTEPYFDEGGGGVLMVTYTMPIPAPEGGRFDGIVTAQLSLDWLRSTIGSMDIGEGGYAVLLSRTGLVIHHPRPEMVIRESIFSLADEVGQEEARRVGQSMIRGETGFVEFHGLTGGTGDYWLSYAPVPGTGWSLGALFPRAQITAKLLTLWRRSFVLGLLGLLGMTMVAVGVSRSITRPIRDLQEAAAVLARGNLEAPIPAPPGKDEIARLAGSFRAMRDDLRTYIDDLRKTTAEKARIERDLQTARAIQLDLLPTRFAFTPPRPEAEIHALLEPAREIGGDFYDFFPLGRDRLFLALGDVSGKGIPAALFMAVSKTGLKALIRQGLDPATALLRLNEDLVEENEEGMFLTVFCAVVDLRTGEVSYACGGHGSPFLLRRGCPVELVPPVAGPLIGLDGGRRYEAGRIRLGPGDILVLSSDGVTEAEDSSKALYGEERAAAALSRLAHRTARAAVEAIREDVRRFVGEAPASDDLTLLAFRYVGHDGNGTKRHGMNVQGMSAGQGPTRPDQGGHA
jgi:sigma-B regulation protein RsbU (phosphoserine phosphatase)